MEEMQEKTGFAKDWMVKIRSFLFQSVRVWHVLRKPTTQEFKSIAKISALGILAIGVIGFAISDLIKFIERIFIKIIAG